MVHCAVPFARMGRRERRREGGRDGLLLPPPQQQPLLHSIRFIYHVSRAGEEEEEEEEAREVAFMRRRTYPSVQRLSGWIGENEREMRREGSRMMLSLGPPRERARFPFISLLPPFNLRTTI